MNNGYAIILKMSCFILRNWHTERLAYIGKGKVLCISQKMIGGKIYEKYSHQIGRINIIHRTHLCKALHRYRCDQFIHQVHPLFPFSN